jgi:hypothetical protein
MDSVCRIGWKMYLPTTINPDTIEKRLILMVVIIVLLIAILKRVIIVDNQLNFDWLVWIRSMLEH